MKGITKEQKDFLSEIECVRLSEIEDPLNELTENNFINYRTKNELSNHLLSEEANDEDRNNIIAYYVIRTKKTKLPLFYFSIKCGIIYDYLFKSYEIKDREKLIERFDEIIASNTILQKNKELTQKLRKKLKPSSQIPNEIIKDVEKFASENDIHVGFTYSGAEIVHFCKNETEDALNYWENCCIPHSLGVFVFWEYIVDIIITVSKYIGCQYLYLFAADEEPDGSLVAYYHNRLDFKDDSDKSAAKPFYDHSTKFMYQETINLAERKKEFFDNFNKELEEEV